MTMNSTTFRLAGALLTALGTMAAEEALACSSCGCTLTTDWAAQGFGSVTPGLRTDLRFDYLNQTDLRSGTKSVDRSTLEIPNEREIQQQTRNLNYSLYLDYTFNADWGVTAQIPYFDRYHTTIAPGDTDISTSHTKSLADVRVVGRYQGFSPDHSVGMQLGLKLPTGSFNNTFIDGPQAGQPLDRGLQPGTGTTDLLLGGYKFGALNRDWDYFVQGVLQLPLDTRQDFRPGNGFNLNFGVQYVSFESWTPRLQINTRIEDRDEGAQADTENSGATLVYLSPGAYFHFTHSVHAYAFVQLPIYQRVNGLQLEPKYTTSIGVRFEF
jgi:hypothetical protein